MLIGQSVIAPAGGGPILYGPWFPRQGDKLTAVFEVSASSGGSWQLTCAIETKNNEDSDGSATQIASFNMTSVVTQSLSASGCKELVRFKFAPAGEGAAAWLHFRSNPPIWQPN